MSFSLPLSRSTARTPDTCPAIDVGYNLPVQNKFFPYIALAVGISALSLSAMFVRWAEAPGPVTGFYRLLISTILLTPLFIQQQKQLEPIDKKYLLFPILAGIFTAFDFAFWNSSLKLQPPPMQPCLATQRLYGLRWLHFSSFAKSYAAFFGLDFLLP